MRVSRLKLWSGRNRKDDGKGILLMNLKLQSDATGMLVTHSNIINTEDLGCLTKREPTVPL